MLNESITSKKKHIISIAFALLFLINIQPAEAGIVEWWCESVGWLCSEAQSERSMGVADGYWIKTEKQSGIEKFILYNINHRKESGDLIIEADINLTVYNFLKDAYQNPTLQKCFVIQGYIQDDYPSLDCNDSAHRQQVSDILTGYIENGWQLLKNGVDRGFVQLNKSHVTITVPNIKHLDKIRIGQFSLVNEYQDINLINYNSNWFDVNISLLINEGGIWNDSADTIWVEHRTDKEKFGANVSKTSDTYLKYKIESSIPIKKDSGINYYISRSTREKCGQFSCNREERHQFLFQDICTQRRNNTVINLITQEIDGTVLFDPQCSFNQIDSNNLEIEFWGEYNPSLGYILVDPTVTIVDVSSTAAILTNITAENNFTHLTINTEPPYDNLVFYMTFDTNTSLTTAYDLTKFNNDGDVPSSVNLQDQSSPFGKALDTPGTAAGIVNVTDSDSLDMVAEERLSIFVWMNPDNNNQEIMVSKFISNTEKYELVKSPEITCGILNSAVTASNTATVAGVWQHIGFTFNSTTCQYYFNGVPDGTTDGFAVPGGGGDAGNLGLGGRMPSFIPYDGSMDEVMIFNVTLNDSQVLSIFNNQSSRFLPAGVQEFQVVRNDKLGTDNKINITINNNSTRGFSSNFTIRVRSATIDNYSTSVLPFVPEFWFQFDNRTSEGENETFARDFGGIGMNISCEDGGAPGCPPSISADNGGFFNTKLYSGDEWTGTDSDILNNMTILAWINTTATGAGGNDEVIEKVAGAVGNDEWTYSYDVGSPGEMEFNCGGEISAASAGSLPTDTWQFIGVTVANDVDDTVTSQTIEHYLNGELLNSVTYDDTCLHGNAADVKVGNNWVGQIDDLMVFQRILTSEEINEIYVKAGFDYDNSKFVSLNDPSTLFENYTINEAANYSLVEVTFNPGNATDNSFITPNLVDNILIDYYREAAAAVTQIIDSARAIIVRNSSATIAKFGKDGELRLAQFAINDSTGTPSSQAIILMQDGTDPVIWLETNGTLYLQNQLITECTDTPGGRYKSIINESDSQNIWWNITGSMCIINVFNETDVNL